MNHNHSILKIRSYAKTIHYDQATNLPTLFMEGGIYNMHNMIQDGASNDSLTANQRQLIYWHRRLAHMDFKN